MCSGAARTSCLDKVISNAESHKQCSWGERSTGGSRLHQPSSPGVLQKLPTNAHCWWMVKRPRCWCWTPGSQNGGYMGL